MSRIIRTTLVTIVLLLVANLTLAQGLGDIDDLTQDERTALAQYCEENDLLSAVGSDGKTYQCPNEETDDTSLEMPSLDDNAYANVIKNNDFEQFMVGNPDHTELVDIDGEIFEWIKLSEMATSIENNRVIGIEPSQKAGGVDGTVWCVEGQADCTSHLLVSRISVANGEIADEAMLEIAHRWRIPATDGSLVRVQFTFNPEYSVEELTSMFEELNNGNGAIMISVDRPVQGADFTLYAENLAEQLPLGFSCWYALADTVGSVQTANVLTSEEISHVGPSTPCPASELDGFSFQIPSPEDQPEWSFDVIVEVDTMGLPSREIVIWTGEFIPELSPLSSLGAGGFFESVATVVTTSTANFRTQPRMQSSVISVIPEGTTLDVIEYDASDEWAQVFWQGQMGWVSNSLLISAEG